MKLTKVELTEEQKLGLQASCTEALYGSERGVWITEELLNRMIEVADNAIDNAYSQEVINQRDYPHRPHYAERDRAVAKEAASVLELLQELKGVDNE